MSSAENNELIKYYVANGDGDPIRPERDTYEEALEDAQEIYGFHKNHLVLTRYIMEVDWGKL